MAAPRFTDSQLAELQAHYKRGMVGTGREYTHHVQSAAEDSKLDCKEVKFRSFRKAIGHGQNFRSKHSRPEHIVEGSCSSKTKRVKFMATVSEDLHS